MASPLSNSALTKGRKIRAVLVGTGIRGTSFWGKSLVNDFPDILEFVAKLSKPPFCVGFAAETENLEKNAEAKRRKKKIPLLAANLVPNSINSDESELILLDDKGKHLLPEAPKIEQARHIIKHVSLLYKKWKK